MVRNKPKVSRDYTDTILNILVIGVLLLAAFVMLRQQRPNQEPAPLNSSYTPTTLTPLQIGPIAEFSQVEELPVSSHDRVGSGAETSAETSQVDQNTDSQVSANGSSGSRSSNTYQKPPSFKKTLSLNKILQKLF